MSRSTMLSDQDPNGGGRTSRGSNISALSRASGKTTPRAPSSDFPAVVGRGISSMLRTETEMGNVGEILLNDLSGFGSTQHRTQRQHASSRMSTASSMSNTSSGASKHIREYPSSSFAPRYTAVSNSSQHGTDGIPSAVPNPSTLPLPGMLENRNRDPKRSQSMTHTVRPPYNLSNNRSFISLRHAHGLQLRNPYAPLVSHRTGLRPPYPSHQPISSALSDDVGTRLRASHTLEGRGPPDDDYGRNYANAERPHDTRGQHNVGQGQPHRGLSNPHNVGQMRIKLPSQPSSRSVEDQREEEGRFPSFDDGAYGERLDCPHNNNLQPHRVRLSSKYPDDHFEAPPLPANYQQRIAAERSHFKSIAPGSVSRSSMYWCDNPLIPKNGTFIKAPYSRGDMEELEFNNTASRNLTVVRETREAPVQYYDYTEHFYDNKYSESDGWDSGSLAKRENRPMSTMTVSPELENVANSANSAIAAGDANMASKTRTTNILSSSGSLAAQRITKDAILAAQATSGRAQTWSDEQSSESCIDVPDELPGPALLQSVKDCKDYSESTSELLLQREEHLTDMGSHSFSAPKVTTSTGYTGPLPSFQFHSCDSETVVGSDTTNHSGVCSPNLLGIPIPLPVYPTQEHFPCFDKDSCATCVRASSQVNLSNIQTNTHLGRRSRVPPVVGVGPRHIPLRLGSGVVPHRDSPLMDIQEDSTAELEVSRYQDHGPSRHLPDVKEESHEGSNSRSVFGTPSSAQASGDSLVSVSRLTVSRRRSDEDSNASNAFTQSHGLPPMRFSQVDLLDELADDVGLRHCRSMEELPHVSHRLDGGSLPRPVSAGEVQPQRTSLAELEEVERAALSMQPTATTSLSDMRRACSLELQAEMEGLAIPSVGGLTQSFSEFFPSLKEHQNRGESAESPADEGAHRVQPAQKRSSARLRPMHGSPHMVVTEDDVYDELSRRGTEREKEKEKKKEKDGLGCIDGGVGAIDASGADAVEKKSETAKGPASTQTHHETAPPANPQTQPRTFSRRRSNAFSLQDPRYPVNLTLPSRSPRSFAATSEAVETRPCNPDTNYPPATSKNTTADAFLPQSAAANHPPHSSPSHPHNRLSEASSTSALSTAQTATASLFRLPAESSAQIRTHDISSFSGVSGQPHEVGERYPTSALSPPTAIFRDHLCGSDISDGDHYDTTRKTKLPLHKPFSTACKTTLYNSNRIRVGRGKSNIQSPESTEPSAIPIVQDNARQAQDSTVSNKTNSHTSREVKCITGHLKTWWQKSSHRIRQLITRRHSSSNHV